MAGVDISWPEAKAYIADSVSMYESDDADFKMVSSLRQLRTDIATLINSREADAKKIIAGACARLLRAAASTPHVCARARARAAERGNTHPSPRARVQSCKAASPLRKARHPPSCPLLTASGSS
ncbi:hypothetical protein EON67_11415 [archaeon]|nr:MAG: hypothetical protein EON67_11415 [archaeon]